LQFGGSAGAQIDAAWTNVYVERAVKQIEQGNDEAAKGLFDEAIKRDSSAARRIEEAWANGYIKRGVALIGADNDGDAKASFAKATQHDPSASKRAEEALVEAHRSRHGSHPQRQGR
jgi:Tfp pilus assembly protein PilF